MIVLERINYLDELADQIQYYDEVLTQSARNYAFTGDRKWRDRYTDTEPKLELVINEAIDEGNEEEKALFSSIDASNVYLITGGVKQKPRIL